MNAETSRTRVGSCSRDDRVGDGDPVELGQLVVEERDLGLVLLDRGERLPAVAGLRQDLDLAARQEGADDALPVERMVVGDDDGDAPSALLRHARSIHRTPPLYAGALPSVTSTVRRAPARTTSSFSVSPGL